MTESGLPKTLDEYFTFIDKEFEFLSKRNKRIKDYCNQYDKRKGLL